MAITEWKLDMKAEPIVPAWTVTSSCLNNGSELQRAIIKGFTDLGDPLYKNVNSGTHEEFTYEKIFTFNEHGEFFRGALTMAGLRYAGDFYDLLKRYGTIKVTVNKYSKTQE